MVAAFRGGGSRARQSGLRFKQLRGNVDGQRRDKRLLPGGVAISADGTTIVAASYTFDIGGPVYTSRDSGTTWTTADVPNEYWESVTSSSDRYHFSRCGDACLCLD